MKIGLEINTPATDSAWESLRRQIYARAIKLNGGVRFDFRELLTNATLLESAATQIWSRIKNFRPDVVVGPGYGAAPLLFGIAMVALRDGIDLNVLMVRDERKNREQKKWVEGARAPRGSRAVIVDDFLNSGNSVRKVEIALSADGHDLNVVAGAVLFDMWQIHGSRQISLQKFPIVSVFRRHDIGLSRDCFDAAPPDMKGSYPDFLQERRWWRYVLNTNPEFSYKCAPLLHDELVIAADDQSRIWCFDIKDGAVIWQTDSLSIPKKGIVQQLRCHKNCIIVGCYDGTVSKIAVDSGKILWRWKVDAHIHATPAISNFDDSVIVNTEGYDNSQPAGRLVSMNWETGLVNWQYVHHNFGPGSPIIDEEGTVFATSNAGTVVALDGTGGGPLWTTELNSMARGRMCALGKSAFCACEDGLLYKIEKTSGEILWSRPYGAPGRHQFLIVHEDSVILFDGLWHVIAFNEETGEIEWLSRLRSTGCWGLIAYKKYLVALTESGNVAVFDPRKKIKVSEQNIGGIYMQPPSVESGSFVAASNNDGLQVFEINSFYEN